jgi:hypothetical protein
MKLNGACAAFGKAWKANYKPPDPKRPRRRGACRTHVPWFVDEYGICGVFGEGGCVAGCDALNVLGSLRRKMVRQLHDLEARHKAHTLHHTAPSFIPVLDR